MQRTHSSVTGRAFCLVTVLIAASASTGCSRTFYRRQADIDAYSMVREKANHPHWALSDYSISVDPRSRMYDPYAVDCPPIPPDDATAHQLMHCVNNKRGWPFWHDNGDQPHVESPTWPEYIEIDDQGILRVNTEDAVRLALLHSRTYQQQLETLYVSALSVSAQRFAFDTQFFTQSSVFGDFLGPVAGGGRSRSTLTVENNAQLRRSFTTGADLLVGFANSLMWQFSGPDDFRGNTLINFSLIQPLLRDAGRERILEGLTQAERTLLANVRAMEQFRQGFYVNVVTGGATGSGPNQAASNGQLAAGPAGGGSAPGGASNFLGLLRTQREIVNQEDNVRRLRRNLGRLSTQLQVQPQERTSDFLNQGLQAAQARQALLSAESRLISLRNGYENSLDSFKVDVLSLPPQICFSPADDTLKRFELIDPAVIRLPEDFETIITVHTAARREIAERIQNNIQIDAQPDLLPVCTLPRYEGFEEDLIRLRPALAEFQRFANEITTTHLPSIQRDLNAFRQSLPGRKVALEKLAARIEELQISPCGLLPLSSNPLEAVGGGSTAQQLLARVEESLRDAETSYELLNNHFQDYTKTLNERQRILEDVIVNKNYTPPELFELVVRGIYNPLFECGKTRILTFDVVEEITRELVELQILQAVARTESVELNDIDLRSEQALEVARKYRRDWMNARSQLVDIWRQIEFTADQLQGDLSILFSGDIGNVTDNPFNLQATRGRLSAGVQFDAPITRLLERNAYRVALINYQQSRRNYYNFEDQIAQGLRDHLRSVTANQINFELQRLAVIQATQQVMLNAFIDQESQRALTTRITAARDVVQALGDLLNAQNAYMGIFINYEVLRLSLDFQLGTMQLDSEGLWIDPGTIGAEYGQFDPWLWQSGGADALGPAGETLPPATGNADPVKSMPPAFLLPTPPPAGAAND